MSKLNQLKAEGKLAGWWDFRTGSLLDKSGNGNDLTPSGLLNWKNGRYGKGINFQSTGIFTALDDTTLDVTAYTILYFAEFPTTLTGTGLYLLNKSVYEMFVTVATGRLAAYNRVTATLSNSTTDIRGARMAGVRLSTGEKPDFFKNGSYGSTGDTALTITNSAVNLAIGNYVGGTSDSYNAEGITYCVVIANVKLTDQEISQIYDEYYSVKGAGDPKTSNYHWNVPKVIDSTLVCHLDAGVRTANGYYADLSGNGNNGQYKGIATRNENVFGAVGKSNGVTGVVGMRAMNAKASLSLGTNDFSYGGWFNTGDLNANKYLVAAYNSTPLLYLLISTAGALTYRISDGTNNVSKTYAAGLGAFKDVHVVVANDKSGNAVLYINGVAVDDVDISAVGNMTTANQLLLLANGTFANPTTSLNGGFKEFRLYNGKALSATEVKNWYNEYATKPLYQSESRKWLPTLANVTAGEIGNTGFKVSTGTWKTSEDANKQKWIENVVAGVASMTNPTAYGTYVFGFNKGNTANVLDVMFIADEPSNATFATQDGYQIRVNANEAVQMNESVAGTQTTRMYTANSYVANTTDYMIAVTRSSAGEFTFYIKGGAYTAWTLITATSGNPVTDSTTTTSKYLTLDLDAGDKFRLLGIHAGVLGLPELTNLYS